MKTKQDQQNKCGVKPILLEIAQYHMEKDFLLRDFLTILEGVFLFQGYEPIREEDYKIHYQLFPHQESLLRHVECAVSTGHLPASSALINGKKEKVIGTYEYLKWIIENVSEDRFAPFLNHLWITLSADKEFTQGKSRNKRSYRSKEEK